MRKGQLTIAMIVVLVMIAVFASVIYINSSTTKHASKSAVEEELLIDSDLVPIKAYVESCIEFVTKENLEKISKQGGVIYLSQDGTMPDPVPTDPKFGLGKGFIEYDDHMLQYGIMRPFGDIGAYYFALPPFYPNKEYPEIITGPGNVVENYKTLLGWSRFPHYEMIRKTLQTTAENGLMKCVSPDDFLEQDFELIVSRPNITVNFTSDSIYYDINFPIEVIEKKTGRIKNLNHFVQEYQIRMRKLLDFITESITNDITDPRFSIKDFSKYGMKVDVMREVNKYDQVIEFRDPESVLLGKEYSIRTASKNRNPVLHLLNRSMKQEEIEEFYLCEFRKLEETQYYNVPPEIFIEELSGQYFIKILNPANCTKDQLIVPLTGYDPDDDNMTFQFSIENSENNVTYWSKPGIVMLHSGMGSLDPLKLTVQVKDQAKTHDYQDWLIKTECWEHRPGKAREPCGQEALKLIWQCSPFSCAGGIETRTCSEITQTIENPAPPLLERPACAAPGVPLIVDGNEIEISGANFFSQITIRNGGRIKVGSSGWLYLKATEINIENGIIDGHGAGQSAGPGRGNDGCGAVNAFNLPICGVGGGGGHSGPGLAGSDSSPGGAGYGNNALRPLIDEIGSGGGKGSNNGGAGGKGGAAILIEADSITMKKSTIDATGASGAGATGTSYGGGGGSGGAIYLVADEIDIDPDSKLLAKGGDAGIGYRADKYYDKGIGAPGRIKLETEELSAPARIEPAPIVVLANFQ